MDLTPAPRPIVVGYYRSDPYVPQLMNTALVAVFAAWARREGYELGVPYRDNDGTGGAFDAMLGVLTTREDVAGVIVPTVDHLGGPGPELRKRLARIDDAGKQVFIAYPTP